MSPSTPAPPGSDVRAWAAVQRIPGPLLGIDSAGRIRYVSEAATRVLGGDRQRLLGVSLPALLTVETAHILEHCLGAVLATDGPEAISFAIALSCGEGRASRWLDIELRPFDPPHLVIASVIELPERLPPPRMPSLSEEKLAALGEEHRMLVTLLENMPGMMYRCRNDPDWTMEFASDGCRALCGYSVEEVVENRKISFGQIIYPEDRAPIWETVQLALHEMVPFELTYRITRSDGEVRWVWERGRGIYDDQGELLALEGFITDIHERQQAEAALAEKERTLRALLDHSTQFMGMLDTEGHLLMANRTALVTVGVGFEQVYGDFFWDTPWWSHSPKAQQQLTEGFERARHGESVRFETQHISAQGKELQIDFSLKPVRDEHESLVGFIAEGRDITDRKLAEQALRESEEKFSRAFRASPDSISITDFISGLFLEVNDGFERVFGYPRHEVIGHTSAELGVWAVPEQRLHMFSILKAGGSVREFHAKGRHKSGEARDMVVSAECVEIGGRMCAVLIVRDITEINLAAEAQARLESQLLQAQKLEALGTLAGGIAHDFNNILTAIYSFADLSMRNLDNPVKVQRYLSELRRASERAADLVKQILAFSRHQKQERRPTQIQGVVREVLKLLRATLPATVEIEASIDDDVPLILADPGQLHQVVMNLSTNAAHAMKGSTGTLTISLDAVEIDDEGAQATPELLVGRYARLSVQDTGHGMSTETISRIYEPFFTTKAPGEGTGLGLPVVHGIVRAHEGAIVVNSELGKGTRFELYFPQSKTHEPSSTKLQISTPQGRGEHILFIDDEQAICESARGILEYAGYKITTTHDPEAALALFLETPESFDMVVTDLTMPKLTGLDLASRMLARRPNLPVLLLSGYSASWSAQKVREAGLVDLVTKPFTFDVLLNAIRTALDDVASAAS
ncbi:MAG: PAS domain S-box protein [Polyangiaceae bacterium]